MIDLRAAKTGDKFVDENSNIVELIIADPSVNRYVGKGIGLCGGRVFYGIYTNEGCNVDQKCCDLTLKHEPRHWLKDLPDAELFSDNVKFIASDNDNDGVWWAYGDDPEINGRYFEGVDSWSIYVLKMPTLTGDEWKLSKISIDELRVWQKENGND